VLIDTNVLLRALQVHDPHHAAAFHALETLPAKGRELYLVPQNLVELWVVMTRPTEANGLGWDATSARAELDRLERLFTVLPETENLYAAWKRLVTDREVVGKTAHDSRLVAFIQVNGLSGILTFDRGFSRFPNIEVIHPADLRAVAD
jgi:predicted nucleic acid-binding protein